MTKRFDIDSQVPLGVTDLVEKRGPRSRKEKLREREEAAPIPSPTPHVEIEAPYEEPREYLYGRPRGKVIKNRLDYRKSIIMTPEEAVDLVIIAEMLEWPQFHRTFVNQVIRPFLDKHEKLVQGF
jgi:hypothetical protein